MKDRRRMAGVLAGIVTLAGCAGVVLTEQDRGQTREVFQGTAFSVSLPRSSGDRTPELKGTIIRFLGREIEESAHREVFRFKAEGLGEDVLRIPPGPGGAQGDEFTVRLRVSSPSGEPPGIMHQR